MESTIEQVVSPAEAERNSEGVIPVLVLIWQQRGPLLRFTAIGLVVGVSLAFLIPKRFESRMQFIPPDSQSMSAMSLLAAQSSLGSMVPGMASSLLGLKSFGATAVAILQSRTVQDDIINRFDLRKVYWCKSYVDARKELTKNTVIDEDKKSGVITVVVTDKDPYRARAMTQAYLDDLDRLIAQLNSSSAHRQRIFLEERIKTVKQDLDDASRQLSQFSSKNATYDPQNQSKAMMDAAGKLQAELILAESELRALQQMYSDGNVRLRVARARVGELRHQLERLGGSSAEAATADSDSHDLYPPLRKLPLLGLTYSDLYRRAKIQEAVYEVLTKQYELAKVEEAKEIPILKVLDAPDLPEKKSFPPRTLITFFGALLGLFAGMGWILGKELWWQIGENHPAKSMLREIIDSVAARRSRLTWSRPS